MACHAHNVPGISQLHVRKDPLDLRPFIEAPFSYFWMMKASYSLPLETFQHLRMVPFQHLIFGGLAVTARRVARPQC